MKYILAIIFILICSNISNATPTLFEFRNGPYKSMTEKEALENIEAHPLLSEPVCKYCGCTLSGWFTTYHWGVPCVAPFPSINCLFHFPACEWVYLPTYLTEQEINELEEKAIKFHKRKEKLAIREIMRGFILY